MLQVLLLITYFINSRYVAKGRLYATNYYTEGALVIGIGWGGVALIRMSNGILQQLNDLLGPLTEKEGRECHQIEAYNDCHEAVPKELATILLE